VVMNAAAALLVSGRASAIRDGVRLAQEALDSGQAAATLERLVEVSRH